jgi:hypothetical protein
MNGKSLSKTWKGFFIGLIACATKLKIKNSLSLSFTLPLKRILEEKTTTVLEEKTTTVLN